jgi:hypothetical protein
VNCGLILNQNRAIEAAHGEYISIYHDDDIYHPEIVKRSVEILDRHPRVGVVCSAVYMVEPDAPEKARSLDRMSWKPIMPGHVMRRELLHRWDCRIPAPTTMVRRKCYEQAGAYKPEFAGGADREMWLRILRNWDLAYISEPMARLRHHFKIGRFTAAQAERHWTDLKGHVEIQRHHLEQEFRDAPLRLRVELQRLRLKRFKEFWRWGMWAVAKGNNDEYLNTALTAFRDAGMRRSATILEQLYRSEVAHSACAGALHLYRHVGA